MGSPFDAVLSAYFSAYARGDAAGCAAVFAPDASVYSPWSPPAHGRDAICRAHEAWLGEAGSDKTWEVLHARSDGYNGHCVVRFEETIGNDEGGTGRVAGIGVHALIHDTASGWLILYSSFNDVPFTEDAT